MSLTRGELKEWGVPDEAIDKVMKGYGEVINSRIPKDEAEAQTKLAVEKALKEYQDKNKPVKPTDSDEYKELLKKVKGYELTDKIRGAKIKDNYVELVKSQLNPEDFDNSLKGIKEKYPEFFVEEEKKGEQEQTPTQGNKAPLPTINNANTNSGTQQKSQEDLIKEAFSQGFI